MTSLTKKISTDIVASTFFDFSSRFQNIVYLALISSISVRSYGAFMQLMSVLSILELLSVFSLREAFENISQSEDTHSGPLYYSLVAFVVTASILLSITMTLSSTNLSQLTLGSEEFSPIFTIGSMLLPVRSLATLARGYFRAKMQIKTGAVLRAGLDYSNIIGVVVAVMILETSLKNMLIVILIIESVYTVLLQAYVIKNIGIHMPSIDCLKMSLHYSSWLTVSRIGSQLSSKADRLLLGFFIGASAVGIYSIAYGLASLILVLVNPIRYTFFPEFSRLIEEGNRRAVNFYTSAGIKYFLTLSVPGVAGLYFVSNDLIPLFVSDSPISNYKVIITILGGGIILYGLDQLQGVSLIASRKTKLISIIRGSSSIANVILNVILIPLFGVVGASVSTTVTYAVSAALLYMYYTRDFKLLLGTNIIIKIGFATASMSVALSVLPTFTAPVWNIISKIALGATSYIGLVVASGVINVRDLTKISS